MIEAMKKQGNGATYLLLRNDYVYWRNLYRESMTTLVEDQRIIKDLQDLNLGWKRKFLNFTRFVNFNMLEFSKNILEDNWCMCLEDTPPQVFNFVKLCKKMVKELAMDLATI